jgi:hypothetical protein
MNSEEMVFEDLAPVEVPVRIGKKRYVLREASADAVIKYRNALTNGAVINPKTGTVIQGDMAAAEPIAVAACLYEVWDENKDPRPVLLSEVLKWRNSIVAPLFNRLRSISPNLMADAADEEKAKNEPSAGTGSSV